MSDFPSQPKIETSHTPTPWEYRAWQHDDWGWIRGPKELAQNGETIGPLVALARCGRETYDDRDEHRRNGTDPYEANARFIVEAVNNYASLKARIQELVAVLKAYEQWEADIILENECWSGQNLRLTDEIYDRMIELQTMRNAALQKDTAK